MPVSRRTLEEERKFAAMRAISEWVDDHRRQESIHRPPWGSIGVGGADFDFLLKATVGEAYLRVLRHGGTPDGSYREAVIAGNQCVEIWNTKTHKTRAHINNPHELKRWDRAAESESYSVHLYYLNLMQSRGLIGEAG